MKDSKIISIDTHSREYTAVPTNPEPDHDSPAAVAEMSVEREFTSPSPPPIVLSIKDLDASELPILPPMSSMSHVEDTFQDYQDGTILDDPITNISLGDFFVSDDDRTSEEGSVLLRWGNKMESLIGHSLLESEHIDEHGPANPSERPKDDNFVSYLRRAIKDKSMDNLSFLFTSFDDLDGYQNSTIRCMLRSNALHDELSNLLLSSDFCDVKYTPTCRFLYKCVASDCPYQRKFAIRFLPSLIWLLWTRDLTSLSETISILHALYLIERNSTNGHKDSLNNHSTKDGIDWNHNLFPTTRFPDLSRFKRCIYQRDQSDMESDDLDMKASSDQEIAAKTIKLVEKNFPTLGDSVESLPHCFPLVLVSLRLYSHYVDRMHLHTPNDPHSLQQFCAVIGRLCNPNAPLPDLDWSWEWEDPHTGKISVNAFLPESLLNAMLQIIRFCLNFPKTEEIAFWALSQFHLYVSTCLIPTLTLQSLCLLEHDYCQNGHRRFGRGEAKATSKPESSRPSPPARTPSHFGKKFNTLFNSDQMMKQIKKMSSIGNVLKKGKNDGGTQV